jgi:hypothetical protein
MAAPRDAAQVLAPLDAGERITAHARRATRTGAQAPGQRPPFPLPDEAMYHGLPGQIVNDIDPYTEACRPAVLVSLPSGCGAMIGRGPHVVAGLAKHPASIWGLLIGGTSLGAKGTADHAARMFLRAAGPDFMRTNTLGALSSGEGLIHRVRDASEATDKDGAAVDAGVADKRLYVVVPEFRQVIAQTKRDSSILSTVLRDAWDSREVPLSVPNRGDNAYHATGAHIVMMAHVTPGEFRRKFDPSDADGGTLNRFLLIASRSSKDLPRETDFPTDQLHAHGRALAQVITAARDLGDKRIYRTEDAEQLWIDHYTALKNPTGAESEEEEGIVSAVTTRARPHVLRLALTYALLDGRAIIDAPHLTAALALWDYALASARWLFNDYGVNPELAKLRAFITAAGEQGVTRDEITSVCFAKHPPTDPPLDDLIAALGPDYEQYKQPTRGRPRLVYRRTPGGGSGGSGETP